MATQLDFHMDCFTANFQAKRFCNHSSADVQSLCSLLQPLALYSLYLSHLGTTTFPHFPFLAQELQQLGYLHAAYLLIADALRLRRACNCPLMPPTLSSAASPAMTISFMKSSKFLRFRVSPEAALSRSGHGPHHSRPCWLVTGCPSLKSTWDSNKI